LKPIALTLTPPISCSSKRRMGVRGTAGSTPAQPGRISHQRESGVFGTPNVARSSSRPSSVMSDSSTTTKGRKLSTESLSTSKISALGKSMRVNNATAGGISTPSSTSKSLVVQLKARWAHHQLSYVRRLQATPTPAGRASSHSRFPRYEACRHPVWNHSSSTTDIVLGADTVKNEAVKAIRQRQSSAQRLGAGTRRRTSALALGGA